MGLITKVVAVAAIATTILTVRDKPAIAQGAAACNNQPNMAAALTHLRNARGWLAQAEHNKGGWRDRAMQTTETAIHETERGCAFADTH
jgi:hypothetical protein